MSEHPDLVKPAAAAPPRLPVRIEEFFAALAMALICLITFANVLVRYFTDESFAFTEEFSVFLMVVLAAAFFFVADQMLSFGVRFILGSGA